MRIRTLAMLILVLGILATSFAPATSASEDDIIDISPTITTMETPMETTVVYRWGIYNNGSNPHILLIDILGGERGWSAELSDEDSYIYLEPKNFTRVELTVKAPKTRDFPDCTYTLSATVRDIITNEPPWTMVLGSVNTSISEGAYIPPTKVLGRFDDPLGNYIPQLDNEWGVFTTTVLVWLLIGLSAYFILDPIIKQFTKWTKTDLDDKILAIVKKPIFWLILIYGLISSLSVLNFPWSVVNGLEMLYRFFLIFLGGWMAFKIFKDVLIHWARKYTDKTETTIDDVMLPLFEKVGMVFIVLAVILSVLNLFGVDVTMLVAGMGVAGLVIAFAAQDTLGNFISGMFLLTDRPFKVGDLVLMENGDYCRVDHIGMRSTKLYNTFDHDMIILPNSKIANEKVINLTEPDNKMKVRVTVGVDYSTDIQKAKQIMLDAANAHPDTIHSDDRLPFVRLTDFGDSAIHLKLYTWVHNLDDQWRVGGELRETIFKGFKKEGISIPFPQRVVHIIDERQKGQEK